MKMKYLMIISFLCIAHGPISVNCSDFSSLIANSPFATYKIDSLPSTSSQQSSDAAGLDVRLTANIDYELRGVFVSDQVKLFNVYDTSANKCKWIKQGDDSSDITVESFDPKNQTLTFYSQNGEKHIVKLKNYNNDLAQMGVIFEN